MARTKFLSSTDKEEVYDDVQEKKAYPELILKANILNAQDVVLMSERKLMNNYRISGRFLKEDIVEFEGNLVLLWSFIRQMTEELKILQEDRDEYRTLCALEFGENNFKVKELLNAKNFLMKSLHRINITNLFNNKGNSFDQEIRSEY